MAVDGTYLVKAKAFGREVEGTVDITTDGADAKATVKAAGREVEVKDGKVNGDTLTGVIEGKTPIGHKKFKIVATVEGDEVKGKLKSGPFGVGFAGTRVEEA